MRKFSQLKSQRQWPTHKTTFPLIPAASSGDPKTTLQFYSSLGGLTELIEGCYAHSYGLSEGRDTDQNQSRENTYRMKSKKFKIPESISCGVKTAFTCQYPCVEIYTEYCQPKKFMEPNIWSFN